MGQEHIAELLERAESGGCELFLNVVDLGEIAYIVDIDRRLALAASHIKASYPIAYADCFAAALALEKGAALVTGDPEFKEVGLDASIPIIRLSWMNGGGPTLTIEKPRWKYSRA